MIRVLVADDDADVIMSLSKNLAKEEDIKVIDMSLNGTDTINSYLTNKPDVLILDMKMPKKSGIEVLNELNELCKDEKNKCNVIVLSGEIVNFLPQKTNKVYRIYTKPCDFSELIKSIREIYRNNTALMPNYKEMCEDIFLQLGFNLSSQGTDLLIKSVLLLQEKRFSSYSMKEVYKELSIREKIPSLKIKWNIEKSIDSMFRYSDIFTIKNIFPDYDERKPTPKYIIGLTLYKLHNNNL